MSAIGGKADIHERVKESFAARGQPLSSPRKKTPVRRDQRLSIATGPTGRACAEGGRHVSKQLRSVWDAETSNRPPVIAPATYLQKYFVPVGYRTCDPT
jgi:hypothetical protein